MSTTAGIARIRELTTLLNRYRDEYYNQNAPSVSDEVYDRLFDELVGLEERFHFLLSDSPTQTVGFAAVSSLEKTVHVVPLLSLEKTKRIEELTQFAAKGPIMLMLKLDGLTVKLTYENGELVQAATRGDGNEGEVITHNARAFRGVPVRIPYKARLIVSGEAFIHNEDFEALQDSSPADLDGAYRNARNLAAGSVRLLDAATCRERRISFLPFNVLEGLNETETLREQKSERLFLLESMGFGRCDFILLQEPDEEELQRQIDALRAKAEEKGIPIDGIVATYDSISYSKTCGRTGHHWKDGLAFKFDDELSETHLQYIEWSPSRSGEIAPVAVFDTVQIDGCDVSRASLHNLSFIKDLELVPGCRILVSKRNMIIPHVEENLDRGRFPFICDFGKVPPEYREHWISNMAICAGRCADGECDGDDLHKEDPGKRPCALCVKRKARGLGIIQETVYPAVCPCCGSPTRVHQVQGDKGRIIETLFCDNPDCASRRLAQFVHFASKKAMNIEGLSEATLETFIRCGWLQSFLDIYHLDDHKAEIIRLDGFGEKSWQRLWDAIQRSQNTTFERYLISMDIPMIGNTASRALAERFGSSLTAFEEAVDSSFDFTQLEDFGETLHQNIHTWFQSEDNRILWEEMKDMISIEKKTSAPVTADQDNPFVGCTIVVTGKVEPYTRDGINAKIASLGAHAGSSVSKNTDYLICGENAGSKLDKARALGVQVLSPAQFFSMIGE